MIFLFGLLIELFIRPEAQLPTFERGISSERTVDGKMIL